MAKSVAIEPLQIGSAPEVLAGLQPENPLVNTIGGLVSSLLGIRPDPATVLIRYPRTGQGELRRVMLLNTPGFPTVAAIDDLWDDLRSSENGTAPQTVFSAENTPLASKRYSVAGVTQTASLGGTLPPSGSLADVIFQEVLAPKIPSFTIASFVNKLEDAILVNGDVETLVMISQLDGKVRMARGEFNPDSINDRLNEEEGGLLAALSMENYTPPSGAIDKHFFESGATL